MVTSEGGSEVDDVVRDYEAFIEVTVVDEARAYPLTIDFIEEDGDQLKKVTKMTLVSQVNFSSYDKADSNGGNCTRLNKIYNISSNMEGHDGKDPINIRVEIRSNPVAMKSYTRCKYYVYDMSILSGGTGFKKGDIVYFDIPAPDADPDNMPAVKYEVTEIAKYDKGVELVETATIDTDSVTVDTVLKKWKAGLEN